MRWEQWLLVVLFLMQAGWEIGMIDKPREPMQREQVVINLCLYGFLVYVVAGRLS